MSESKKAEDRTHYSFSELGSTREWVDAYWKHGYLIVKEVFGADELDRIRSRFDRWYAEGMRHPSTFRHQNKIIWLQQDDAVGKIVRGMQWPSYEDDVLDAVRTDARMYTILEPLIGGNLKQIINQLHWKAPGARVTWGLHRDVRSRKPSEAFRELATSYVQTGLAVDRHWADNGAMNILPDSHRMGRHDMDDFSPPDHRDTAEDAWVRAGFDLDNLIVLEMDPGDVALWTPFTIHGGGINMTPDNPRRLYINGYVIAENCDRGEWVFRDGNPVPLDLANPALIQYGSLKERPEAHYPGKGAAYTRIAD
jgi:ectoine hydroxylase-related dioxygenase (phytanoyl-CoA dioxygenase family)